MSDGFGIALTFALLAANAFFVGAEFAVMAARRSQIEPKALAGSRSARTTLYAMEHVSLMLATAQLGITVCSVALGAISEPAIAHQLEPLLEAFGAPEQLVHPFAFAIALTLVVSAHVVLGEMVPKNLAIAGPERMALLLAPPLVAVTRVAGPLIRFLNWIANGCLRLLRVEPKDEVSSAFTRHEVQSMVTESHREGLLDDQHGLLTGAIEFSDKQASDLMVPAAEVVTLPSGATPADVERLVARTGLSRFPTVDGHGDLQGYLHLKDVLYAMDGQHEDPVPDKRVRSLVSVGRDDEVEDALAAMQKSGSHLARVVDPEGGTVGVLFLEDVLEELVGEVRDAMQRDRPVTTRVPAVTSEDRGLPTTPA